MIPHEINMIYRSPYFDPSKRHIPNTLSEREEFLASLLGGAPTFRDEYFEFQNIDTEFEVYHQGLNLVRQRLGEERYAQMVAWGVEAKALFAADPDDKNGKTSQGFELLHKMEDLLGEVRSERFKAKLKDEEGEITGD
jgi:hypothetical protein